MLFIIIIRELAVVAQVVEYVIGNDEVPSSSLGNGTVDLIIKTEKKVTEVSCHAFSIFFLLSCF